MAANQLPIGVRYGKPTASTRTMVLSSLTNTAATVACNGISYPVTWVEVGADRGSAGPDGQTRAGYAGTVTITGLAEGVSYQYVVTQGANSRSGTLAPFWEASPADFSFFVVACDRPGVYGGEALAIGNMYGVIRDYAQNGALPCIGYMHADDLGYADYASIDDSAFSGKRQVCQEAGNSIQTHWLAGNSITAHDFIVAYFAHLGLLGDATDSDIAFGRNEDRVWCRENLAFFPQWGNHEFGSPVMYGIPNPWTRATPMHATNPTTGGWDGVGITAWNALFAPIQPSSVRSSDAHSKPWGILIGGTVKVVATDWVSSKDVAGVTCFGSAQIDDVLSALQTDEPFKLLLMSPQIRKLDPADTSGSAPYLADNYTAEYERLFTSDLVNSVMQSSKTNGVNGSTVVINGDLHHAYVASHRKVAGLYRKEELFYSINAATVNGSSGHAFTLQGVTDDTSVAGGDSVLHYSESYDNQPHCVRVDVYATRQQPCMHINLITHNGVAWDGRWYARSGNVAHHVSFPTVTFKGNGI